MTNPLKVTVLTAVLSLTLMSEAALALPINRCIRLVRNPQVQRETIVNVCQGCVVVKLSRQRPGNINGMPSERTFTLLPGNQLPLSFKGPGQTRITSESPCPRAR